jgi:hypothetical protein
VSVCSTPWCHTLLTAQVDQGVGVAALEPAACLAAVLHLEVAEWRGLEGGGSGLALPAPVGRGRKGGALGAAARSSEGGRGMAAGGGAPHMGNII